jgi:hypothetical protein
VHLERVLRRGVQVQVAERAGAVRDSDPIHLPRNEGEFVLSSAGIPLFARRSK